MLMKIMDVPIVHLKLAFFQMVLMHLSFPQTDEHFSELEF